MYLSMSTYLNSYSYLHFKLANTIFQLIENKGGQQIWVTKNAISSMNVWNWEKNDSFCKVVVA